MKKMTLPALRYHREKLGWTQNELAERANVPLDVIVAAESGQKFTADHEYLLTFTLNVERRYALQQSLPNDPEKADAAVQAYYDSTTERQLRNVIKTKMNTGLAVAMSLMALALTVAVLLNPSAYAVLSFSQPGMGVVPAIMAVVSTNTLIIIASAIVLTYGLMSTLAYFVMLDEIPDWVE